MDKPVIENLEAQSLEQLKSIENNFEKTEIKIGSENETVDNLKDMELENHIFKNKMEDLTVCVVEACRRIVEQYKTVEYNLDDNTEEENTENTDNIQEAKIWAVNQKQSCMKHT